MKFKREQKFLWRAAYKNQHDQSPGMHNEMMHQVLLLMFIERIASKTRMVLMVNLVCIDNNNNLQVQDL